MSKASLLDLQCHLQNRLNNVGSTSYALEVRQPQGNSAVYVFRFYRRTLLLHKEKVICLHNALILLKSLSDSSGNGVLSFGGFLFFVFVCLVFCLTGAPLCFKSPFDNLCKMYFNFPVTLDDCMGLSISLMID